MRDISPGIKVGLVGCGYWGSKHLRVLNEIDCRLVALCEQSPRSIARQPRSHLPPIITKDYDEFLSTDAEAVIIATPAHTHFELAARALRAGKHVLVEKPFTTTSSDALDLVAMAEERGLALGVGHTYLYHPAIQHLRELIATGYLGDLYYAYSSRLNFGLLQSDIDVLWDLAPHDLSILMYVLDRTPLAAAARGSAFIGSGPCEVAHVDVEFLGGPSTHLYLSWLEPTKIRRLTIVGSERAVLYDDLAGEESIRIFDRKIEMVSDTALDELRPQYSTGGSVIPRLADDEPLRREDEDFFACIASGRELKSSGKTGLDVVRVLEAASKSARLGGAMQLLESELRTPATALRALTG